MLIILKKQTLVKRLAIYTLTLLFFSGCNVLQGKFSFAETPPPLVQQPITCKIEAHVLNVQKLNVKTVYLKLKVIRQISTPYGKCNFITDGQTINTFVGNLKEATSIKLAKDVTINGWISSRTENNKFLIDLEP